MKLSCNDAAAARACAAADKPGAMVGLLPDRLRHEARRLAKLGQLVSLKLAPIPAAAPGASGFWGTASGRVAAGVELANQPQTRRWCVVRLDPVESGAVTTHAAVVILRFEVLDRETSMSLPAGSSATKRSGAG